MVNHAGVRGELIYVLLSEKQSMGRYVLYEGASFSIELHNPLALGVVLLAIAMLLSLARRRQSRQR